MNVFQATLVFISFVAANGSYPAVIFREQYLLAQPTILSLSNTEVEMGFDYTYGVLYFACPLDPNQLYSDANPEVLVLREIETEEKTISLDNPPICKSPPQVIFERLTREVECTAYSIGYKVYLMKTEDNHDGTTFYSGQDNQIIRAVFTLNFDTETKRTVSVEYELYRLRFITTASNDKHTFVYDKNLKILKIDLDDLYNNFNDEILPAMMGENRMNQLAHASGIQKVQLAPRDDFPLDTWKMATYGNINTVPIWRVLLLRWNAIEIYLRKLLKRNIKMKVETGVSGTLELTKRFYESNTVNKLHIPKYVWKLVTEPNFDKNAMLIVMHNDPFTAYQEPLCMNICTINGWLVSNTDYRTGFVYCCKMNENIAQILGYPNKTKDYGIFSFTKDDNNREKLEMISRILSDPREKLYDW